MPGGFADAHGDDDGKGGGDAGAVGGVEFGVDFAFGAGVDVFVEVVDVAFPELGGGFGDDVEQVEDGARVAGGDAEREVEGAVGRGGEVGGEEDAAEVGEVRWMGVAS